MHNKQLNFFSIVKQIYGIIKSSFVVLVAVFVGIGVVRFDTLKDYFSKASPNPSPASIEVDCSQSLGQINKNWQNLSQGGESNTWTIEPIQEKVRDLKPKYIRIDHLYDFFDIVQYDGSEISMNFSRFDKIINEIISVGAKPYLALSYMPSSISKGDILEKPKDWNLWQEVVKKTIEHVSGDMGISEVYYEIWNEPDLFGSWKTYGDKSYTDLYLYASRGATSAQGVQDFKLGGPAITALYKNWFDNLIKLKKTGQIKLDFFSWHRYAFDVYDYEVDIANVETWLVDHGLEKEDLELHITEWGPDSDLNEVYDNKNSAAHLVAVAISLEDFIDKSFVFEVQDGESETGKYWGRWGVLTSPNTASDIKPRYNALKLLSDLSGERLRTTGQGYYVKAITTKKGPSYEMIVVNYDKDNEHGEIVPINFKNVENGNYDVIINFFDGTQKNFLKETSNNEIKFILPMKVNEIAQIKMKRMENISDLLQ